MYFKEYLSIFIAKQKNKEILLHNSKVSQLYCKMTRICKSIANLLHKYFKKYLVILITKHYYEYTLYNCKVSQLYCKMKKDYPYVLQILCERWKYFEKYFVGRIIKRKGIFILLYTLKSLQYKRKRYTYWKYQSSTICLNRKVLQTFAKEESKKDSNISRDCNEYY